MQAWRVCACATGCALAAVCSLRRLLLHLGIRSSLAILCQAQVAAMVQRRCRLVHWMSYHSIRRDYCVVHCHVFDVLFWNQCWSNHQLYYTQDYRLTHSCRLKVREGAARRHGLLAVFCLYTQKQIHPTLTASHCHQELSLHIVSYA